MAAKLTPAMKTQPVRIPLDLYRDGQIIAAALEMTFPEYVTDLLRQARERDLPQAAKIVAARAEAKSGKGDGQGRKIRHHKPDAN